MNDKLEIKLNDIADELLILDKNTVDNLFKLEDPIYCIGLYLFYYKTAKWQKTNIVKANDIYARKCLNIGKDKLQKIKGILKKNGLISIVQRRENGKISGWFVELHYIVSKQRMQDIKIKVDDSNNPQIQQVENSTSSIQETNALRKQLNALRKQNKMLKEQIKENNKKKINKKQLEQEFEEIWKLYPRKIGKSVALSKYIKARQDGVKFETVKNGVERYAKYCKSIKDEHYIKHGSTWFNQKGWEDEYKKGYESNTDWSGVQFGIKTRNED